MRKRNNVIKIAGNPVTLIGTEVEVGDNAPDFTAIAPDLTPLSLNVPKVSSRN